MIWDKVFYKPRVPFDGLATNNNFFLKSSHIIYTHLDVIVEVINSQSSVSFEFYLDEDFIKSWWGDLIFQIPHATIFCRSSTAPWWISSIWCDHSGRVWRLWWIFLGWWVCQSVNLIFDYWKHYFELFCELCHFLIIFLLVDSHLLLLGFNWGLYDDKLFIRIVLHRVSSFCHIEAWVMDISITEINKWLWFGATWRR